MLVVDREKMEKLDRVWYERSEASLAEKLANDPVLRELASPHADGGDDWRGLARDLLDQAQRRDIHLERDVDVYVRVALSIRKGRIPENNRAWIEAVLDSETASGSEKIDSVIALAPDDLRRELEVANDLHSDG